MTKPDVYVFRNRPQKTNICYPQFLNFKFIWRTAKVLSNIWTWSSQRSFLKHITLPYYFRYWGCSSWTIDAIYHKDSSQVSLFFMKKKHWLSLFVVVSWKLPMSFASPSKHNTIERSLTINKIQHDPIAWTGPKMIGATVWGVLMKVKHCLRYNNKLGLKFPIR